MKIFSLIHLIRHQFGHQKDQRQRRFNRLDLHLFVRISHHDKNAFGLLFR